ncbi:glycosyltransferase family 9 protein [Pelagibacteraceae bacterium]|jgi:heptosyltransferase-2|nr:glycosyltransferase family 9 protein [Pelagibacteraceae bacterium]
MKVLVIQPKIGMGDMVIYLPYIHAISKRYKTPVSLLVKKNSKADEILQDDDCVREIIFLERSKEKNDNHDGFFGFIKISKEIKTRNFDKVFIFNSSLRYYLISKYAGIKKIMQYPLFRKNDNIVISAKIFTEEYLDEIISTQPKIILKENKIQEPFDKSQKHICIGLSASGPTKRWGINNYINLCEKLNEKFPCKFYLAGGKNDEDLINQIINSKIGINCMSFKDLKIKDAMPIIKNCNLYIGNDTGWLHIASALGLKCLALFMDSPVMAYGKYSKNISVIVPEGETEESTTHDTLGGDKISFSLVYEKTLKLLN